MIALAQSEPVDPGTTGPAWSPYLVGALIGVLSMFTFYFSAKPLGASTAFANIAGLIGRLIAPRHTDSLHFPADKKAPQIDWQVALVIGVIVGAFLAAWGGGEITGRWLPPMWVERFGGSVWLRMAVGFLGGGLMAFGARMAGGCTSGHGISGVMQLSVGSWIALLSFFVGGILRDLLQRVGVAKPLAIALPKSGPLVAVLAAVIVVAVASLVDWRMPFRLWRSNKADAFMNLVFAGWTDVDLSDRGREEGRPAVA
jgi:uncharacterized protein